MKRSAAHFIFTVIAILASSSVALAKDAFNFDDAARMAMDTLLRLDSAAKVERVGEDQFKVQSGNGAEMTVFLGNLLSTINHDPDNASEHVEHFTRVLMESLIEKPEPPASELRAMLFPMVRHQEYVDYVKSTVGKEAKHGGVVIAPIAADYWLILGIDTPESVSVVQRESLAGLSMSDAELVAQAKANFEARLTNVEIMESGGARMPVLDGASEVSILAIDSFWRAQFQDFGETIVAVAPSRDVLVFCPASARACIERIAKAARTEIGTVANAVSANLIKWTEDGWEPYEP